MADERTVLARMLEEVERFQLDVVGFKVPDRPQLLLEHLLQLRMDHLDEEVREFKDATTIEGQADALVDIAYVALGGLIQMGIAPGPIFDAVHRANMTRTKTEAQDGHKLGVVKGTDFREADLALYVTVGLPPFVWPGLTMTGPQEFAFPDKPTASDDGEAAMIAKKRTKLPIHLVPYVAVQMAAKVFGFGAAKYSIDGYKTVDYKFSELVSALERHVGEFKEGHDYDLDAEGKFDGRNHSGEPLIGHMLCCVMMLAWRWAFRRRESDDRGKVELGFRKEWPL